MNKLLYLFTLVGLLSAAVPHCQAQSPIITTIAGTGDYGFSGDGGPATNCKLGSPEGLATAPNGDLYIADKNNNQIRKVSATTGIINFFSGGPDDYRIPSGLATDATGNLYMVAKGNNRVFLIEPSGLATPFAGTGSGGYSGFGSPATSATFDRPTDVAVDAAGNVYVTDRLNQVVRKINESGIITTFAGNAVAGYNGDGVAATDAQLNYPSGVAVDATGNVYIADLYNNRIRMVSPDGKITTVAGNGAAGYSGDGGPAIYAQLYNPTDVFVTQSGELLIADMNNHRIRKVAHGIITTVAGNGLAGYSGDGGLPTMAQLYFPTAITVHTDGTLYIADALNNRIRKVVGATSIANTQQLANVTISPNPTSGPLKVTLPYTSYTNITLSNSLGSIVLSHQTTQQQTDLDLSNLAPGIYFLNLHNQQQLLTYKVVKY